jgi:hypothetical protein
MGGSKSVIVSAFMRLQNPRKKGFKSIKKKSKLTNCKKKGEDWTPALGLFIHSLGFFQVFQSENITEGPPSEHLKPYT